MTRPINFAVGAEDGFKAVSRRGPAPNTAAVAAVAAVRSPGAAQVGTSDHPMLATSLGPAMCRSSCSRRTLGVTAEKIHTILLTIFAAPLNLSGR